MDLSWHVLKACTDGGFSTSRFSLFHCCTNIQWNVSPNIQPELPKPRKVWLHGTLTPLQNLVASSSLDQAQVPDPVVFVRYGLQALHAFPTVYVIMKLCLYILCNYFRGEWKGILLWMVNWHLIFCHSDVYSVGVLQELKGSLKQYRSWV